MNERRESGAVLLVVLIALALLASLAGVVARISQSEVASLRAERIRFEREVLVSSALAVISVDLGKGTQIAEDGRVETLMLPGGKVEVRVQAASGLMNPNYVRHRVLVNGLIALGASQIDSDRLAALIERKRDGAEGQGFHNPADLEEAFKNDAVLWPRVSPYFTLLGKSRSLDPTTTPNVLRSAATALSADSVDFNGDSMRSTQGYYEIRLHIEGSRDVDDPVGKLWTHLSVLRDRGGHIRIFTMGWPETEAPS